MQSDDSKRDNYNREDLRAKKTKNLPSIIATKQRDFLSSQKKKKEQVQTTLRTFKKKKQANFDKQTLSLLHLGLPNGKYI